MNDTLIGKAKEAGGDDESDMQLEHVSELAFGVDIPHDEEVEIIDGKKVRLKFLVWCPKFMRMGQKISALKEVGKDMEKKTVEQLQKILVNMVPAALEGVMACELFRLRHADTCPKIVHLLIRQAMGAISQGQDGVCEQLGSLYVDVQKDVKEAMDTEAIKTFNALLEA